MEIQFLTNHRTRNMTGFGLNHSIFGKIFIGHFDSMHKIPHVYNQILTILENYDVIAGNMNTGWHHLITPFGNKRPLINRKNLSYVYNPISYLAPNQPEDPRDARLDMVICKYEQPLPIEVGVTFDNFHEYESPRDLMKMLKFPSYHKPIKVLIKNNEDTLVLGFWTVSDPIYRNKFYDSKNKVLEHELNNEHKRLELTIKWIDCLLENCNILGLADVPILLMDELKLLAKKHGMNIEHCSEHSDIWRPNEPIPQFVVMY